MAAALSLGVAMAGCSRTALVAERPGSDAGPMPDTDGGPPPARPDACTEGELWFGGGWLEPGECWAAELVAREVSPVCGLAGATVVLEPQPGEELTLALTLRSEDGLFAALEASCDACLGTGTLRVARGFGFETGAGGRWSATQVGVVAGPPGTRWQARVCVR
ncbi:MAG: hypothetical protein ACFCGT_08850 [Sandaracinaceae bacterium]